MGLYHYSYGFFVKHSDSVGVHAYTASAIRDMFKLDLAVDESEQGVVGTTANVVAGMNVCASLADDDVAGGHIGTVRTLHAQTLRLTVTTVLGRTYTFFMCKKL